MISRATTPFARNGRPHCRSEVAGNGTWHYRFCNTMTSRLKQYRLIAEYDIEHTRVLGPFRTFSADGRKAGRGRRRAPGPSAGLAASVAGPTGGGKRRSPNYQGHATALQNVNCHDNFVNTLFIRRLPGVGSPTGRNCSVPLLAPFDRTLAGTDREFARDDKGPRSRHELPWKKAPSWAGLRTGPAPLGAFLWC